MKRPNAPALWRLFSIHLFLQSKQTFILRKKKAPCMKASCRVCSSTSFCVAARIQKYFVGCCIRVHLVYIKSRYAGGKIYLSLLTTIYDKKGCCCALREGIWRKYFTLIWLFISWTWCILEQIQKESSYISYMYTPVYNSEN